MKRKSTFFILLLSLFISAPVMAQDVDEILAKYVEAIGGADAMKAISSVKTTGKMMIPMMGLEMGVTMYQQRPMKFRMDMSFQGQAISQGYDGEIAWNLMPPPMGSGDVEVMSDEMAEQAKRQGDIDGFLVDPKAKGYTIELKGQEDFEGSPVYVLSVSKDGEAIGDVYLDSEYYIPMAMKAIGPDPMSGGEVESLTYFGDYKEVGGIMLAHSMETKVNGQVREQFVFESIEANVDIDSKLFNMPKAMSKQ